MHKNTIVIFFSLLFMAFISVPSIVVILDDSIDVSMSYSTSEEEKGSEETKEHELLFFNLKTNELNFASMKTERNIEYFFNYYSKAYTNILSPPPDLFKL